VTTSKSINIQSKRTISHQSERTQFINFEGLNPTTSG